MGFELGMNLLDLANTVPLGNSFGFCISFSLFVRVVPYTQEEA